MDWLLDSWLTTRNHLQVANGPFGNPRLRTKMTRLEDKLYQVRLAQEAEAILTTYSISSIARYSVVLLRAPLAKSVRKSYALERKTDLCGDGAMKQQTIADCE